MNWARVKELREEVGSEAFEEVLELFLEETDELANQLKASPNPANLESDMHFLKGAALNLGFDEMSELCQAAEAAARNGQGDTVDVAAVLASYDVARASLLAALPDLRDAA